MDWVQFQNGYDLWPPLQSRLEIVRSQLASVLSSSPAGHIRLISVCAGDGRDVIGALAHHPRREDVSATLVELNPELVSRGLVAVNHFNLSSCIRFVCGDATLSNTYADVAPADIVVLAGVLGNVRPAVEPQLIDGLRSLCCPGGSVVWTRGVGSPNGARAAARIRQHLADAGFREGAITHTTPHGFVVGTHIFDGVAQSLTPAMKLFEFTDFDQIDEDSA